MYKRIIWQIRSLSLLHALVQVLRNDFTELTSLLLSQPTDKAFTSDQTSLIIRPIELVVY
jgi:hypothetical protein